MWIAEKKHANYFSRAGCNHSNSYVLTYDWCGDDDTSIRLAWSDSWNIGSISHPFVNGVVSRDSSYEFYGGGRTECYWSDIDFRGWVPDNIGGWEATPYVYKLLYFGFGTTSLASCGSQPPPPPPPLSASIAVEAPYYTAVPAGGYPPYTYLWEACAIDCAGGGGELSPALGVVRPYTVVHGWQSFSTELQVYWTSSGWNLRLTVADLQNAQAQAQYYVP